MFREVLYTVIAVEVVVALALGIVIGVWQVQSRVSWRMGMPTLARTLWGISLHRPVSLLISKALMSRYRFCTGHPQPACKLMQIKQPGGVSGTVLSARLVFCICCF